MSAPTVKTKLEAVNQILTGIGELPVAALDTAGSSIQADAERTLDRELRRILSEGLESNTLIKTYTSDASGNVTLGGASSTVLDARPSGRTKMKYPFAVYRNGALYDKTTQSYTAFGNAQQVDLEITESVDFVELPEKDKEYIIEAATRAFQQTQKGSPELDRVFMEREAKTSLGVRRAPGERPINSTPPYIPTQQQQQGQ